jgi:hypothetical protein
MAELTLQDGERFLKYLPSTVAAASILLARHVFHAPALWVCRVPPSLPRVS